ncbi:MAG TPA: transglycosylase SLT domain-containing protein [Burkholderiales bacterium]|nr:transglycosylase SLT domain-containing protein [Burkholderiales bacterium]
MQMAIAIALRLRTAAMASLVTIFAACAQLPAHEPANPPAAPVAPTEAAVPLPEPAIPTPAPTPAPQVAEPAVIPPAEEPRPANLWVRIRKGFAMPDIDNPLVREWEQWYSSRPDYVARMVDRGRRVMFHVVEEVERRKMPAEIALLPMIESAYNPQAYSRAHASGMWQFIPSTGKLYGLEQNWWYDGRRDIVAATNAALDYLEKLHGMFGNWELALASYNWGEGAVSRAVARNQARGLPTDYENLNMPSETRNYLPKLQAVKNIISDPARYGLALADIPNESYFASITIPRHIDVELAARFAEIPVEEFRFLNPAHNKPVINADAAEAIVLPKDKVEAFRANLASNTEPLVSWQAYTVKRGERIEKIAARYDMSVAELRRVNHISPRSRLAPGQPLLVPVTAGVKPNLPVLPAPALAKTRTAHTRYVPKSRRGALAQHAVQHKRVAKKAGKAKATKTVKAAAAKRAKVAASAKRSKAATAQASTRDRVNLAENH